MQEDPALRTTSCSRSFDWLEERIVGRGDGHRARTDPRRSRHRLRQDVGHNLELMNGLALLHGLGCPIVLGASRKRMIGALSAEAPADKRLGGTHRARAEGSGTGRAAAPRPRRLRNGAGAQDLARPPGHGADAGSRRLCRCRARRACDRASSGRCRAAVRPRSCGRDSGRSQGGSCRPRCLPAGEDGRRALYNVTPGALASISSLRASVMRRREIGLAVGVARLDRDMREVLCRKRAALAQQRGPEQDVRRAAEHCRASRSASAPPERRCRSIAACRLAARRIAASRWRTSAGNVAAPITECRQYDRNRRRSSRQALG